jgi:hypothetical protein
MPCRYSGFHRKKVRERVSSYNKTGKLEEYWKRRTLTHQKKGGVKQHEDQLGSFTCARSLATAHLSAS